ncbi:MAG: acetolactate synthase small subunit [Hirschia sp.]|nr:acetolactate synthase small subunit [Hirschia sp.]MBF19584.1 acetolactate synthase small subunit [Hirschia sp.]|tara:strand:- start:814 stop:1392 length:579 start_codon:yes stop_codon:yes gene_type:complete
MTRSEIEEMQDEMEPASAYDMHHDEEVVEKRTLAAIVDNEPGVLARVVGLFSARGYNIESLTVAEVDRGHQMSRITIVTSGTKHILEQIQAQLLRLVPVARVIDITSSPAGIERELALVKVAGKGEKRVEALRISEIFRANVIDTTNESFVFEITGASTKIDQFAELMEPLGLVEMSRTGVLSLQRGAEPGA